MKKLLLLFAFVLTADAADPNGLRFGGPIPISVNAVPTVTNTVINAAGVWYAAIFQAPRADVVTQLMIRIAAHAGTMGEHRISLQTISAGSSQGFPSATILASLSYTPVAGDDGLVKSLTITRDGAGGALSSYTLTKGTNYAIVVEPCPNATAPCAGAFVPDGSNNSTFTNSWAGLSDGDRALFPYSLTTANSGSTWTKVAQRAFFGYQTASTTYGTPIQSVTSTGISSGSESGVSFTLPTSWCSTVQIAGIRFVGTSPATNKTFKIVLYNGTTVLQSATIDSDVVRSNVLNAAMTYYFSDATLTDLTCGSLYRIGISPQDATNNVALTTIDLPTGLSVDPRLAFAGGTVFASASRSSCGGACDSTSTAWAADVTTSRPMIELILGDITQPSGASSGGAFGYSN